METKLLHKCQVTGLTVIQNSEPFFFVRFPEGKPFIESFGGNVKAFTDLLNSMNVSKELGKDTEYEEEPIAGVWNDKVRKDCMGMLTAVTEDTHNAQIIFYSNTFAKVDDIAAVVVVDMTLGFRMADGTSL